MTLLIVLGYLILFYYSPLAGLWAVFQWLVWEYWANT